MTEIMNAAEALAREIARVTELRCRYKEVGKFPGMNVGPALFMMNEALERAMKAAGSNDAVTVLKSLEDLKGFTD